MFLSGIKDELNRRTLLEEEEMISNEILSGMDDDMIDDEEIDAVSEEAAEDVLSMLPEEDSIDEEEFDEILEACNIMLEAGCKSRSVTNEAGCKSKSVTNEAGCKSKSVTNEESDTQNNTEVKDDKSYGVDDSKESVDVGSESVDIDMFNTEDDYYDLMDNEGCNSNVKENLEFLYEIDDDLEDEKMCAEMPDDEIDIEDLLDESAFVELLNYL